MFRTALFALALTGAAQAQATLVVNTGTPVPVNGAYPLTVDGTDWLAGQVTFTQALTLNSIEAYLSDVGNIASGLSGDSFTISLYSDAGNKPGALLDSATAHFTTPSGTTGGWNGASGLNWSVNAGTYWAAVEVGASDTFQGVAPVTAPNPLARYAFNSGSYQGYQVYSSYAAGFQIDATPSVPEPQSLALVLAGVAITAAVSARSSRSR